MLKILPVLVIALLGQAAAAAAPVCLKTEALDQIRMTGEATALATDRSHRKFDITFVAACGARQPNVFFIIKPEYMPSCITTGTALVTSDQGVCVAKTVRQRA